MDAIIEFYSQTDMFLLVFTRIIALLIVVPIFSDKKVPPIAKAGLSFVIAIIIIYSSAPMEVNYDGTIMGYGLLVLKEVITGLIMGFVMSTIFQIFFFVGQHISTAAGLSMSNMFDPTVGQQVPIMGNLYHYTAIALLLVTNGHHIIFKGLVHSYLVIPIGQVQVSPGVVGQVVTIITNVFIISLKIAAPVMVTMLILNVALGILARTAPQINMFVIGFPVKIMVSLIMILMTTVLFSTAYAYVFDQIQINLLEVIQGMRP